MENQTTAPVATGQSDVQQNVASSVQAPTTLAQPVSTQAKQENKIDFKTLIPESYKEHTDTFSKLIVGLIHGSIFIIIFNIIIK